MPVPVVDLFAGPGGLGEGFSRLRDAHGERVFQIAASVEKDPEAHKTLELRALYRRLDERGELRDYYRYLNGEISRDELFVAKLDLAADARSEAILATLGDSEVGNQNIEDRIASLLAKSGERDCVLIGGPPCQAYSMIGRARRSREDRATFEKDVKHFLYREYLAILTKFKPCVFVMENVPGLLTAEHGGAGMFELMSEDFRSAGYDLHPIADRTTQLAWLPDAQGFVVNAHEFGVPQTRARVFIMGVRRGLGLRPAALRPATDDPVAVQQVIGDLPKIRSALTRERDSGVDWSLAVKELSSYKFNTLERAFRSRLMRRLELVSPYLPTGRRVMTRRSRGPEKLKSWYVERGFDGIVNHNSRAHMRRDLHRYFFWAEYAALRNRSPILSDVPHFLRPNHRNVTGDANDPFNDRFRVQVASKPSSTITSHIAKDGHYYIHYDSKQCRSLSVREAARLQTFPDGYFFEGTVTSQYRQVGNAVPPYLAWQIAAAVFETLAGRARCTQDPAHSARAAAS